MSGMDDGANSGDCEGRKVFFLMPSATTEHNVIEELVQQEYELYVVRNRDSIRRVLRKYPDSILFVDINEKMPEKDWELWIRALMKAPDTSKVSIGIITANNDEALRQKYLNAIRITCGYTVMKFDTVRNIRQVMEILHAAKAKGRRKFVRAIIGPDATATVNIPIDGTFVKGRIRDISAVGIAFTLDGNPELTKNMLLKDIQLVLQTNRVKVEGILFGSREENKETVYVLLFSQRVAPEVRSRIRSYIQLYLQGRMDDELK